MRRCGARCERRTSVVPWIDAREVADVERKLELIRHDRENQRAVARTFLNQLGHRNFDCYLEYPLGSARLRRDERLPLRRAVFTLSHYLALLHSPDVI